MAKTPKKTEPGDGDDVTVEFSDAVIHDGVTFAAGDTTQMPIAAARALLAAGAATITGKAPDPAPAA